MAIILNNPMPTTGALYVTNPTNPQGKFYKWLGRHYTISGSKLIKRKKPLTQASSAGRKYDQKSTWGKYKKVYDALRATSTSRKSILALYRKDKPHRIREDRKGRKRMMEIFAEEDKRRKGKSTKRKSSSKKSATKKRSKVSASARKEAAEKYKRSRSKRRYQNLVKKYGMKEASAITKLAKSSKSSSSSTKKRGKSMAKRNPKNSWQKHVTKVLKSGGTMKSAAKSYKKSRKNPIIKSKPVAAKYKHIAYQDTEKGKALYKIAIGAVKNLPLYATKADVKKYLSKVQVPSGYITSLTNDVHAALSNTVKPKLSRLGPMMPGGSPSGNFALRSIAQSVVRDLGYLDYSDQDDKKAVDSYFRKMKWLRGAQKGALKKMYISLMNQYETAPSPAQINAQVKLLDDTSDDYRKAGLKKKRRKASAKRKPAKRKSSKRKSSKRKAPKGAWMRTVKKHKGNMKKAKSAYRRQYKMRKNPAMSLGNAQSLTGMALGLLDKSEDFVSSIPVVKHIAPIVNVGLLASGAALIHYQVQTRAGQWLASNVYSKVPFVGQYLLQAPSTANGAAVWAFLSGAAYIQPKLGELPVVGSLIQDLPEVVDQQSANVIGSAAILTGMFLDAWTYFSAGGKVPFLSSLPYVGEYFGDGGQFFTQQMGAISMSGAHDMGAVHMGMHHNPGHMGAINFNQGLGTPTRLSLISDKTDSCLCPSDLAPIEIKAAKQRKMDSFAPLPVVRRRKEGVPSAAAGKVGHRWNWLREMIGDDGFAKLAALSPQKRQEVIRLMKVKASPKIASGKKGAIGMGAYSAVELGALAMSGAHNSSDISGISSPMSGASNAPGGVGGFGSLNGILYAGS